jgi:hypothetical protein
MKESLRKNFTLILAFTLPAILIIGIAISVYLPSFFISTNYNFIYASCGDNIDNYSRNCNTYLSNKYTVENGKISTLEDRTANIDNSNQEYSQTGTSTLKKVTESPKYEVRLFFHDTAKNESREITLEEAKLFTLNNLITSPDGVSITGSYNSGSDILVFGGGRSSFGYFLTKGNSKLKLNIINTNDRYYYQNNFKFIGWVIPGRTNN